MTINIDGRLTTDMSLWITFGSAAVGQVIKNIHNIKGLELSGNLTYEDCECITQQAEKLEYLDLHNTTFPGNTIPHNFMSNAIHLVFLRLPDNITSISENAFANCPNLGSPQSYIAKSQG